MMKVRLRGTDITTSVLGFGCAQIMRIPSGKARQRLLNAAFDAGVCHFDVARMYGLGAAESEVGKFARNRRGDVVLATKFGIDLNTAGAWTARLQGIARQLVAIFPALRRVVRQRTNVLLEPRRYDAAKARSSLEISLRELGTDYLDLYLLHEPTLEDLIDSDVIEFLCEAKSQGKIRAFGISGLIDDVLAISDQIPDLAPVVQFPNDIISRDINRLRQTMDRAIVTYSPFSSALSQVLDLLSNTRVVPSSQMSWLTEKGRISADAVAVELLRYCLDANSSGVVLFSTTKLERLRKLTLATKSSPDDISMKSILSCIDDGTAASKTH